MSHSRIIFVFLLVALMLSTALVIQVSPTAAAGYLAFIVNNNSDLPDYQINGICEISPGSGQCTLRAALDEINATGGGWHSIKIQPMTIVLSSQYGELRVNTGVRVTIAGAGRLQSSIDGGGYLGVRIFEVDTGAALAVYDLTIANGSDACCGGGIQNRGIVYIVRSVLSGHFATASGIGGDPGRGAAIFNEAGGLVTIDSTTLSNNLARSSGGAIRNEGQLIIWKSTFDNNNGYVGGGGAIMNLGSATIYDSTFSANRSAGAGAITNAGGRVYIFSSTFADNFTVSGAPSMTLSNDENSTMILHNTLVYTSQAGNNCTGRITSLGFNLSNDTSCNFKALGDRQNASPHLGPLANNGGLTQTHALLPGSAAIDKGFCVGSDQRGYRRPVNIPFVPNAGNTCDIGAFEVQR